MNKVLKVLISILLVACGIAIGFLLAISVLDKTGNHSPKAEKDSAEETTEGESGASAAEKVQELQDLIDTYFIGEYDKTKMADAVANAMIEATGDRWSYYISAADYAAYVEQMENAYVGIGVTITMNESECIEIIDVSKNGPAYSAGIMVGDILRTVEGESIEGWTINEVKVHVRGEEGTSITLGFERDGTPYTVDIVRKTIDTVVASYTMLDDNIAYITIENFDSKCASETISCIEEAVNAGAKGIVFDVRFNPGGYKNELVQILDYLLPEGDLFRSVDYAGHEYVDKSDSSYLEIPMAVLINADSYSAAEFFAAALQEYEAGIVVGEQTCGKGYFQYTYLLEDGSAVALSSGKYFTPNGVSLAGVGITPDIPVSISEEEYIQLYYGAISYEDDVQLQAAIDALKELTEK